MSCKAEQDGGTERFTHPGDDQFTHHLRIHNNEETLAAYLGFTHIVTFRRFCLSPRALHVARIINAYSVKTRIGVQLDVNYAMFLPCDLDDTFQATYRVSNESIMDLIQSNGQLRYSIEDKAVVLANILVPWTDDIRPKIQHDTEVGESSFKKYYRVIAVSRRCAKVVLASKSYINHVDRRVAKGIPMQPQLGQVSLTTKRNILWSMQLVRSGPDGVPGIGSPIKAERAPKWMQPLVTQQNTANVSAPLSEPGQSVSDGEPQSDNANSDLGEGSGNSGNPGGSGGPNGSDGSSDTGNPDSESDSDSDSHMEDELPDSMPVVVDAKPETRAADTASASGSSGKKSSAAGVDYPPGSQQSQPTPGDKRVYITIEDDDDDAEDGTDYPNKARKISPVGSPHNESRNTVADEQLGEFSKAFVPGQQAGISSLSLSNRVNALTARNATLASKLALRDDWITKHDDDVDDLETRIRDLEREAMDYRRRLSELLQEKSNLQEQINKGPDPSLEKQVTNMKTALAARDGRVKELEGQLESRDVNIRHLEAQVATGDEEKSGLEDKPEMEQAMQHTKGGKGSPIVTRPGDREFLLLLHPGLRKSESAMSVYRGYSNTRLLRQFSFTSLSYSTLSPIMPPSYCGSCTRRS
ncbi:hypothetical protein PG985_009738 [Apiospora marii]|uniref:uncharacterized protein n=1 Tax=Apiospora marii TaxID=335849 RepID=UPI00312D43DD